MKAEKTVVARITYGTSLHILPVGSNRALCGVVPGQGKVVGSRVTKWVMLPGKCATCKDCMKRVTSGYGEVAEQVMALITREGPLTRAEMCRMLNLPGDSLSAVISRMTRPGKGKKPAPRRLRIAAWVRDMEGQRNYIRAVYGLAYENGRERRDVAKPSRDAEMIRESKKKYREKVLNRVSSVFDLGMNVKDRIRKQVMKPRSARSLELQARI